MIILKLVYEHLSPRWQYRLDRFRYHAGLLPRFHPEMKTNRYRWPDPFKACLLISADFEMAWAWRFCRGGRDALLRASESGRVERRNVPLLLNLFDRYRIPITWATVGHLFLDRCERINGKCHQDIPRVSHFENEYWKYSKGDWFDGDPCTDYRTDPSWYAPDLIDAILSADVRHEIACHTFSHIDCSDSRCPSEVMDAELTECKRQAALRGLELKSFVFPGHLMGNFDSLKRHGFRVYRRNEPPELDIPRLDKHGLWCIPGGVLMQKPVGWPTQTWIATLKQCVDRALATGTLLHFWFHPSCEVENINTVFPAILEYIESKRSCILISTMSGLIDTLQEYFENHDDTV